MSEAARDLSGIFLDCVSVHNTPWQLGEQKWKRAQSPSAHTTVTVYLRSQKWLLICTNQNSPIILYFPEPITKFLTNQFDFVYRWWINCVELSVVMAIDNVWIHKYGFRFDGVKLGSTFTH